MDSILKKGLFLVTVTGAITAFPIMAQAADIDDTQDMPTAGIDLGIYGELRHARFGGKP